MTTTTPNSHPTSQTSTSLLTLPTEIREMIYALLPDAQAFNLNPRRKSGDQNLLREFQPPALGQVHPVLRTELLNRMYSHLRLELSRTSDTTPFTRWLGKCGDDVLASIKTITVTLPWNYGMSLIITLGVQPSVALAWGVFDHTTFDSGVPPGYHRFGAQYAEQLRDAQALALTALVENMPAHPKYSRRMWTKEAWVVVKDVVFTHLQCRAAIFRAPRAP